jgi:hypothetical protein
MVVRVTTTPPSSSVPADPPGSRVPAAVDVVLDDANGQRLA